MIFTIFGSTGFIGKNLVNYLKDQEIEIKTPYIRHDDITNMDLGNIIYAIGEPTQNATIDNFTKSHLEHLNHILCNVTFDSFL